MKKPHEKVRLHLDKKNQDVDKKANKGRKRIVFELGDFVWYIFARSNLPLIA